MELNKIRTSEIENYFLSDPELQSDVDTSYLSHKEKYEEAVRRVTIILRKIEKLQSEGRGIEDLYKCDNRSSVYRSLLDKIIFMIKTTLMSSPNSR